MEDFKINIVTSADTQGAKAAAESLQGLGKSAAATGKDAAATGKDAEQTGKQILSLGETTEKGIGIGRMFSEVLNGNFYALGNVTAALKITGAAIKTSFVGVVLLGLTALANFLPTLIEKISGKKGSLAEGFEAAKAAGEKLNEAQFSSLKAELDAIKIRADAAREAIDGIQSAADKLDDAQMEADLADNKVMPGRTDVQKAAWERQIRGYYAERKQKRQLGTMDKKEKVALDEANQNMQATNTAAEALAAVRARVEFYDARRNGNIGRQANIDRELKSLPNFARGKDAYFTPEQQDIIDQRIKLQKEQNVLRKEEQALNDPAILAAEANDRTALAARERDFSTAQGALLGTLSKYNSLKEQNDRERKLTEDLKIPKFRVAHAEEMGSPAFFTAEKKEQLKKPEVRILDARTQRELNKEDAAMSPFSAEWEGVKQTSADEGSKTGAQIAKEMISTIKANNDAMLDGFKTWADIMEGEIQRIRSQMKSGPRGGN